MKTYPKYKPSGFGWIGDIPEHWEMKKLKFLGRAIIGLTYKPEDISENEGEGSLVLRANNIQNNALSLENNVFVESIIPDELQIQKGDILICARNGSRALVGKNICITDESLLGSTFGAFMTVFRTPNWKFISKIFASPLFKSQSGLFSTSTINQLTISTLNNILVPFPSEEFEQTAIAAYLDQKTAQIDQTISEKERLIELFLEERQAIINHAVTKGIRPGVKMKDSGVEWIGDVPDGWEVKKLKYLVSLIQTGPFGSQLHSDEYVSDKIPVINPSNLGSGKIVPDWELCITEEKFSFLQRHRLNEGDIVFGRRGEMGRCATVSKFEDGWLCGTGSLLVRPNFEKISSFLLNTYLSTPTVKAWLSLNSVGSTMENLNTTILGDIPIVCPPFSEQPAIVNYLDRKTAQIDQTISGIQQEIELLQEYRQALIFEAVTGKICVL